MSFDVWSVLSPESLATMRDHVLSAPHTEVGGFLLGFHGEDHQPPHSVVAVEAWDARGDLTRLTFTHAAWEHVHRIQDERYPDTDIVGWYHSHPGHGIFLSAHDQFIQRHFFGAPWQIAVVIDPIARTEGMFAWARGEIVKISERPIGDDAPSADWQGATAFTLLDDLRQEPRERLVVAFDDGPSEPAPVLTEGPAAPEPGADAAWPPPHTAPRRIRQASPALRLAVAGLAIALALLLLVLALR